MITLVDCMQKLILHKIDFVLTCVFGFQHVICTGLWCKVESEKECKTKLDPPMDGTDCDTGKVCFCWKSNINYIEHLTAKETSCVNKSLHSFKVTASLNFHKIHSSIVQCIVCHILYNIAMIKSTLP